MLPRAFYHQPTLELARALLGKHLVRQRNGETLVGRIVEVEAYHQDGDQAAHSYSGKSERNAAMFGPPGHLYVYFIYGMHYCMNVVSESDGIGAAVLIRAIEPVAGMTTMRQLRGDHIADRQLTNGPAKCCQALAIDRAQDGLPLWTPALHLTVGDAIPASSIATSERIGISKSVDLPWRFFLKDNRFVSRKPRRKG
jgi:DNA-3-methyladenine glycosylase